MDLAYSQIRNITCPIRHYFTLIKSQKKYFLKSVIIGNIIHKIYANALMHRNFNVYTDACIHNELYKANKLYMKNNITNIVKMHLYKEVFKKFPKKIQTEHQYIVVTTKLPHIADEVYIYNKPDISYFQKNIATVCEIKTGAYQKYDPLQLKYYSWALSLNSNAQYFVTKLLYTINGVLDIVDTLHKDELQDCMDRYFESSVKAYAHLNIKSITEVTSIISSLIAVNSVKLTELCTIIYPEQCASCNSSIICPAYQQKISDVFKQRMQNLPISDIVMQCN